MHAYVDTPVNTNDLHLTTSMVRPIPGHPGKFAIYLSEHLHLHVTPQEWSTLVAAVNAGLFAAVNA